jgi:hypothetical protein
VTLPSDLRAIADGTRRGGSRQTYDIERVTHRSRSRAIGRPMVLHRITERAATVLHGRGRRSSRRNRTVWSMTRAHNRFISDQGRVIPSTIDSPRNRLREDYGRLPCAFAKTSTAVMCSRPCCSRSGMTAAVTIALATPTAAHNRTILSNVFRCHSVGDVAERYAN